jgi:hypothetical protein
VHDTSDSTIATTGRRYYISVAHADQARQMIENLGIEAYPAAAGCGYPWDFVDCSALERGGRGMKRVDAACGSLFGSRRPELP